MPQLSPSSWLTCASWVPRILKTSSGDTNPCHQAEAGWDPSTEIGRFKKDGVTLHPWALSFLSSQRKLPGEAPKRGGSEEQALPTPPPRRNALLLFVWPPPFPWQLPLSPAVSEEDQHGGGSFWVGGMMLPSPSLETSQVVLPAAHGTLFLGSCPIKGRLVGQPGEVGRTAGTREGRTGSGARQGASLRNAPRTRVRTILPPLLHYRSPGCQTGPSEVGGGTRRQKAWRETGSLRHTPPF